MSPLLAEQHLPRFLLISLVPMAIESQGRIQDARKPLRSSLASNMHGAHQALQLGDAPNVVSRRLPAPYSQRAVLVQGCREPLFQPTARGTCCGGLTPHQIAHLHLTCAAKSAAPQALSWPGKTYRGFVLVSLLPRPPSKRGSVCKQGAIHTLATRRETFSSPVWGRSLDRFSAGWCGAQGMRVRTCPAIRVACFSHAVKKCISCMCKHIFFPFKRPSFCRQMGSQLLLLVNRGRLRPLVWVLDMCESHD